MDSSFNACTQQFFDFLCSTYKEPDKIVSAIYRASLQTVYADYIKQHAGSYYYLMLATTIMQKDEHELLLEAMAELEKEFSSNGVKLVFLKGLTLEKQFYPKEVFRPTSDIDILIGQNDIQKAVEIVNRLGYSGLCGEPYTEEAIIKDGGDHHLLPVQKTVAGNKREFTIRIEMHIHFTKSYGTARRRYAKLNPLQRYPRDNVTDSIIFRAKPLDLEGHSFYVLDEIDNIIFTADHFAHHYTDALFPSLLSNENPYPSVCTRSVFETLLLVKNCLQAETAVRDFLDKSSALDNQTQWGLYLTLRCCNYIAAGIVSDELLERFQSQLKQPDFTNIYEVLLYQLVQNIPDILNDSKQIENKIVCEATRLFKSRKQAVLPAEFCFSNKNCEVIAADGSSPLTAEHDTGHLQLALKLTKHTSGLHFHVEFSDDEYKQYKENLLRININMVFSGKEDLPSRARYVMLASVNDIIWASAKAGVILKKRACFEYTPLPGGFISDFNLTWHRLGFDCKPDRMLFSVILAHIDKNGINDYVLAQSGTQYDIEKYISVDL